MPKKRVPIAKKKSSGRGIQKVKVASRSAGKKKAPLTTSSRIAAPIRTKPIRTKPIRTSPVLPKAEVKPLPPGTTGAEVPIPAAAFQQLVTAAATENNKGAVVWVNGGCELLVITGKVQARLDDGLILISVPVSCDQAASSTIQVPFAVGGKDSPAGMICATEDRPRGPAAIVDVWGDALIAFAWRILLRVTTRAAAQSGVDQDGAGLIPVSITAAKDSLALLPIARHTFDRMKS